jgi:exodeoxyribonuclease V beta subunit
MARRTLRTNWRADDSCLEALRALLQGSSFGDPSIHYVPVEPAEANRGRRLEDAAGRSLSGLDVRLAIGPDLPRGDNGKVDNEAVCRMIERDLAGHVRGLLERARIPTGPRATGSRRLAPSDVAVLVTGWGQARDLQAALRSEGIPAVIAGSGTVLDSEAATQLRYLLDGLERPGDPRRVRMFALSWFVGRTVEQVGSMDDDELSVLQDRLMTWAGRLSHHPVAEVLGQAFQETDVVARVLGLPDGDRHVTDLDHLAELLHLGAPQGRAGAAGLLATLESPPDIGADADGDTDVTARRIESEAAAVQITTIWGAKGLEFPVVCLPMLWRKPANRTALVYTDPESGERRLDVTGNGEWPSPSALQSRKDIATTEESAERLRILYVALTRARHHTAVWWARNNTSKSNALTRLLFARGPDGVLVPHDLDPPRPRDCTLTLPDDDSIVAALDPLVEDSGGTIGVHVVPVREPPSEPWSDPSDELQPPELELAAFDRPLDRSVARWSFTSITRHASVDLIDPYDPSGSDQGADDEAGGQDPDEVGDPTAGPDDLPGEVAPPPPFELLVAGTAFGTFVHGVLEVVDFTTPDLDGDLHDAILDVSRRRGIDLGALAPAGVDGTDLLIEGLHAAITSPLGPLFRGAPLAELDRAHRLDELAFDLRLGTPGNRPTVAAIGRLVAAHLPDGDPLAPWAEALADGTIDIELAGYLTGSIDLVARVRAEDGLDRFVVADYKTNRLRRPGAPRRRDAYGAVPLAGAMIEHHYPLQALLYTVALHRYLRWKLRLPAGTTVVGGAAYLFVRGMTGPDVPVVAGHPHGVFTWEFDPTLVLALSDLLAGRPDPGGPS